MRLTGSQKTSSLILKNLLGVQLCFHRFSINHRMLSSAYGEAAFNEKMCREWSQRFKGGDFDVEDRHDGGKEKIFEDSELEALLAEDSCRTEEELAESLGVTQ